GGGLKLLEKRFSARDFDLARHIFGVEFTHHAVDDDHRIALRADAEPARGQIKRKPERAREISVAVGEKGNFARSPGTLRPGIHNENIVDACHSYFVDASGFERACIAEKPWQMVLVADRGEGAGHRKEHHLAATKNLIRAANLWTSWRHNRERRFGDFIANLDCHGCSFSKRKDLSRSLTLYTESSRGRPTGSLCRKCAGEFCRLFVLIRSRT